MTSGNNDQFELDDWADFTDQTIRRFLLGSLTASEQSAFERRLLVDNALAARVRLAEFELTDDYAYERLSDAERALLAETFLLTADRQQKVRVSISLRDQFAPAAATGAQASATAYVKRLRSILSFGQPAWRFAFAAVVFLVLVGTVWVVVKESRIKDEIKRRIEAMRTPPPANAPRKASHPANNSTPEHQTSPSPMPVHDQTAPTSPASVVALTLTVTPPGLETPAANLPKGEQDIVRLQLVLKPEQPGPYRAELLNIDGQLVFSAESLKAADNGNAQVAFDVPARLLTIGGYQIRLGRDKAVGNEVLASYYFRVR
jgi:hypothetical protein